MMANETVPNLKPIGMITEDGDHAEAWSFLYGLVQEAIEGRAGTDGVSWLTVVDSNLTIYAYGADPPPDSNTIVINEIQSAIISTVDIQTKEPPRATLEPVETGEPPECYWAGPPDTAGTDSYIYNGMVRAMPSLPVYHVAPWPDENGNVNPPLPLDEQTADVLRMQIQAGMMKEQWLVEVNDQLVSDTYQGVFDVLWDRSGSDLFIRENILETAIQGWTFGLYEFDDDDKRHKLRHQTIKQVYIDPTARNVADAAYVGVDAVYDADEAKRLYPNLAAEIDKTKHIGQPVKMDGNTVYGSQYDSRNFKRDIIELRIFWIRNQPCPMTPEQAIQSGGVVQGEVPDETQASAIPPMVETEGMESVPERSPDGQPTQNSGTILPQVATRSALLHPQTNEEITSAHPDWPTYPCIRQITVIANRIVDDRPSEFQDIPVLHNVNIPIPGKPWGLGEPYRLKMIQNARSRMIDAMVAHCEFYKSPVNAAPTSVIEALKAEYGDAYMKPGRTLNIPDDIWLAMGGKIDAFYAPPAMSEALVEMQAILKTEVTEQSGHADVLQGRVQPQIKSGKAIELLQTAASSMIGFKSQRTGDMVKSLAKLMLHSIVWRMTPADVYRIVSKYPYHVLEAICRRAQRIDWDVNVEISSGAGALRQQKKQEAAADLELGAISMESYQEKANIDPRVEKQRMAAQNQEMIRLQATMPQSAQPQPGKNGNGQPNRMQTA